MPRKKSRYRSSSRHRSSSSTAESSPERHQSKSKRRQRSRSRESELSRRRRRSASRSRRRSRSHSRDRYASKSKKASPSGSRSKKSSRRSASRTRGRSRSSSRDKYRSSRSINKHSSRRRSRSSNSRSDSSSGSHRSTVKNVSKKVNLDDTESKLEKAIKAAEAAGLTMTKLPTYEYKEIPVKVDMPTIHDRNLLQELNSDSFVSKAFVSSRSKKFAENIVIDLDSETVKIPEVEIKEDDSLLRFNFNGARQYNEGPGMAPGSKVVLWADIMTVGVVLAIMFG